MSVLEDKVPLYPMVGMHSADEEVEANFGQKSFVFDFNDYMQVIFTLAFRMT